ncbi:hypothetical protein KIW84_076711 [Lathyrus oleraceus]|uniref:Helitron helicase-like domain-containing protein n=1 Tax=Pisum sativum TaxID=3888 RepID=A0A9D4VYT2_PEA|nr:hypothetical protein KIW84_076711 [Pisum sativum]
MLYEQNVDAKSFRMARDKLCEGDVSYLKLRLISKRTANGRICNQPNVSEVAFLIVGDGANTKEWVVLPSSYVGTGRYMDQLYFDGMEICNYIGFPDLFITFTCNPNWPEIQRVLGSINLKAADHPDLISRIFRMKFDELLYNLTKKNVMGKVLSCK